MRGLALRLFSRSTSGTKGKVVLIPDFMGTLLSRIDWEGQEESTPVWMNISRLMAGQFDLFRLEDGGVTEVDRRFGIVPSGVFKRDYGELILTLAQDWDIHVLWYDWRKDLRIAASSLESKISEWFGVDQPVHFVGVGMGGLVARWFIHEYHERWTQMGGEQGADLRQGGRLLLLGVPNRGTFLVPQIFTGVAEIVRRLVQIDNRQSYFEIVQTFRSFPSLYQLLPWPRSDSDKNTERLYSTEHYRSKPEPSRAQNGTVDELEACRARPIPERLLRNAKNLARKLEDTLDAKRTIAISGYGTPTVVDLDGLEDLYLAKAYLVSEKGGDGLVPLELARPKVEGLREYFVKAEHTALISDSKLLSSLSNLLERGETDALSGQLPNDVDPDKLIEKEHDNNGRGTRTDRVLRDILDHRASRRSCPEPEEPTVEEREIGERLTRNLCVGQPELLDAQYTVKPPMTLEIELGLMHGSIDQVDECLKEADIPRVDALAVGLYVGEKPSGPTLKLDRAISQEFFDLREKDTDPRVFSERDLILTQFALRGLIIRELGHPFFLTDPRVTDNSDALPGRLLTVMGMGVPGRFGVPEMTVLARELCWAIGRLGKQHLAVAALGTKDNNLSPADAISGWVRGIKAALYAAKTNGEPLLPRLTLVIDGSNEPAKIKELEEAIKKESDREVNKQGPDSQHNLTESRVSLQIRYKKLFKEEDLKQAKPPSVGNGQDQGGNGNGKDSESRREPTRVTLGLSGSTYRYGAVMTGASVSEREITLPTKLVDEVCTELSTERNLRMQLERGQFLGQLILPEDLRPILASDAPLVMMLDGTMARIPWEMVALNEAHGRKADELSREMQLEPEFFFLGTSRGLTRQLRTTFAPPPEPPPPLYRTLHVLVVADPARDAHLPGAELEGTEVADLFEKFNSVYEGTKNRVEVVRMFGPSEAKLTNVLREIMRRPYDVMHFAGHCVFDKDNPSASGWIFSNGGRLTANELRRIDRVPRFIFSNACESGVTPDRTEKRSVELPPTFAESFFARGVANLVCTAWPVDDAGARNFALALYAALLRMREFAPKPPIDEASPGRVGKLPPVDTPARSMVMYEAMRYARLAIATAHTAARTWGAYQHYGDPFFRLLDPEALTKAGDGRDTDRPRRNGEKRDRSGSTPASDDSVPAGTVGGEVAESGATEGQLREGAV